MKLKVDENLPAEVVGLLRSRGHDVETVLGEGLGGAKDPRVLTACSTEGRALLTLDLDFSNVVAYPPEHTPGLIVLRPGRQSTRLVLALIERVLLPVLELQPVAGKLWVVDPTQVRSHPS